jgi:hypothetical protein
MVAIGISETYRRWRKHQRSVCAAPLAAALQALQHGNNQGREINNGRNGVMACENNNQLMYQLSLAKCG